jgi:hypothetical protein
MSIILKTILHLAKLHKVKGHITDRDSLALLIPVEVGLGFLLSLGFSMYGDDQTY